MRTLFNVVPFGLVLFGSVVPASAQDPQGYGGVIQTVVVSVSVVFGVVITLLAFWWKFDGKVENSAKRSTRPQRIRTAGSMRQRKNSRTMPK